MPPTAEIAVDAAAVLKNRRRDKGMRMAMECLQGMFGATLAGDSHSMRTGMRQFRDGG
jgi:hypothetical protein